jgi:MoaA/NifB/PqqE/SkfB family radical SAM enzyme
MSVETALKAWISLIALAGDHASIHITGGEPFLYWDRLVEILQTAKKEKLPNLDLIETNGGWAKDETDAKQKLKLLDQLGINKLKISCDPFHLEFVDVETVKNLLVWATEILGPDRVQVRWEKYLSVQNENAEQKQAFIQATKDYPCRFTGRAAGKLAQLVLSRSLDDISALNCKKSFLGAKGVHVDPFGNVFSGTCSGIIIGNVNNIGLDKIWQNFELKSNKIVNILSTGGPALLAKEAQTSGFDPNELYAGKCHLCSSVRQFLFDSNRDPNTIGPPECYLETDA